MVAIGIVLDIHGGPVGGTFIKRHTLPFIFVVAVFHRQSRTVGKKHVVSIGRVIICEFPITHIFEAVCTGKFYLASGMPV
jgi:hypothetical protein